MVNGTPYREEPLLYRRDKAAVSYSCVAHSQQYYRPPTQTIQKEKYKFITKLSHKIRQNQYRH
jgi:hypothetical protein